MAFWLLGVLAGWLVGCADTSIRPPPNVIFAEFDPAGNPPIIPVPNDILMVPAQPTAQAVAVFSGPIDTSTIAPTTVIVVDATAMLPFGGTTATFMADSNRLVISPPAAGWPVGHRMAIVLRGSPGGLKGAAGQPVVASPAFYFARSEKSLIVCPDAGASDGGTQCTSATTALTNDQAVALEQLRLALAPLIAALAPFGVPRNEIALAWTFTIGAPVGDGGAGDGGGDGGEDGGLDGGSDGSAEVDGGASDASANGD